MLRAWRIVKAKNARNAFDGESARIYGGRWNTPGTPVVYTAESASLAALEILVHLQNSAILPAYVLFSVEFDRSSVEALNVKSLAKSWRAYPAPNELQKIGDEWAKTGRFLILQVPSAIVEQESNFLINPLHKDFKHVKISDPIRFEFDLRLLDMS